MIELLHFDIYATNFLKTLIPHNFIFNIFFSFFSQRGSSIAIWFMILLLLMILEEVKDHKFLLFLVIVIFLTFLTDVTLKEIVKRPRPCQVKTKVYMNLSPVSCPADFSFPSGHTMTAFAAAVVFTYFQRKRKWLFFTVAVLISYSRIYLGVHYLSDVLAGAIIGLFIAIVILKFFLKPSSYQPR